MENSKTSKVLIFLFCVCIYPVMFRTSKAASYIIIYGIPICYLFFHIRQFLRMTKQQMVMTVLFFILLLMSIFYPTLHRTGDYSYVKVVTYIFRKAVIYLFLVCMLVNYYKEESKTEIFYYYFAVTNAIYVVGTLCFVFVPGLYKVWFQIFAENVENTNELLQSFGYTFRIGWQGFSGFRMTIHCTWSCLFLLYLFYSKNSKIKIKRSVFLVCYAFCFMGNMFYGRSGLIVTIVLSIVGIVVWNRKQLEKVLKFILAGMAFVGGIYILKDVPAFSSWYEWMSRPFINLLTIGSFNNVSFSNLSDMYFLPEWKTILWGDGYFTLNGSYYMETDSGIMRNMLFWGIIGGFFSYFTTIYSMWSLKKKDVLLFLLFFGAFILFEYKGDTYYEFITLFYVISFVESIRKQYLKNCSFFVNGSSNKQCRKGKVVYERSNGNTAFI